MTAARLTDVTVAGPDGGMDTGPDSNADDVAPGVFSWVLQGVDDSPR